MGPPRGEEESQATGVIEWRNARGIDAVALKPSKETSSCASAVSTTSSSRSPSDPEKESSSSDSLAPTSTRAADGPGIPLLASDASENKLLFTGGAFAKIEDSGLLTEREMYAPKGLAPEAASDGAARSIEGPSRCQKLCLMLLARFPALHTFGLTFALAFVFPRFCPLVGTWICVLLFSYGLAKFLATGLWAVIGLLNLLQLEKSLQASEFPQEASPPTVTGAWQLLCQESAANVELVEGEGIELGERSGEGVEPGERSGEGSQRRLLERRCATARGAEAEHPALDPASVLHCVLIPCYKESPDTLEATLNTLVEQSAAGQIVVVLAMEDRDPKAEETAQVLRRQFAGSRLAGIFYTMHQLGVEETAGKSSNENWGFRCAKRWLCDVSGHPLENLVFTTCDADTFFHPKHFEYLTSLFVGAKERHSTVWQGSICFLPNNDALPALCTVRYTLLTIGFLGQLANTASPTGPYPLSVYSLSAKLAHEAGYWDASVVPEDWHMFFRVNLESPPAIGTAGGVRCVPMYLPVGCLGVEAETPWSSLRGCYSQAVRWQWGAIDFSYLVLQLFSSSCSVLRKLLLALGFWEHHLVYPLMWVAMVALPSLYREECLGVDGFLPRIAMPSSSGGSAQCPEGRLQVRDLMWVMWPLFAVTNWVVMIGVDWAYRRLVSGRTSFEQVPQGCPTWKRLLAFLLFPFSDLFLFVLPTFHAHARMFLSTKFEYIVSPKVNSHRPDAV